MRELVTHLNVGAPAEASSTDRFHLLNSLCIRLFLPCVRSDSLIACFTPRCRTNCTSHGAIRSAGNGFSPFASASFTASMTLVATRDIFRICFIEYKKN